jgi:rhodanese-related sulfurtransferase/DNA-binding transcriptional ArsR family regulator
LTKHYHSIIQLNVIMNEQTGNSKREFKDAAYGQLARIGKALSSPKRLELLDLLCQSERSVEALAEETGMSVANASQHLQVLEAARLVEARRNGRFVLYSLADALVCDFFRAYRVLGEDRLAEIEQIQRRFLAGLGELSPMDRETLLQRVQTREVIVIDVRPAEEYQTGHIPGALGIPVKDLRRRLAELPRNKDIVAYCRGPYCVLAVDAVRLLRSRGRRAFRLDASVHDWRARGLPLATGLEQSPKASVRKKAR